MDFLSLSLSQAQSLISDALGLNPTSNDLIWLLTHRCRIAWDQSDVVGAVSAAQSLPLSDRSVFLSAKTLCAAHRYAEAEAAVAASEGGTLALAAKTVVFLHQERLEAAELSVPSAASVAALSDPEDRLDATVTRLWLWTELGSYDRAAAELRALEAIACLPEATMRFQHKAQVRGLLFFFCSDLFCRRTWWGLRSF